MTAEKWNRQHLIGTLVEVTMADGRTVQTRTLGVAQTWGGLDHIEVGGIAGFVLLS